MELYKIILLVATFTTGLVAGLFFTFTTLIMPGLSSLHDRDYLRSFQAIDRILQANAPKVGTQPYFAVVFFGAMASMVAALLFGFAHFDGTSRVMIAAAIGAYSFGMLLPTVTVNLPLNNKIQTYDIDTMTAAEQQRARKDFEPRWVKWNLVRTLAAVTTFALLTTLLFRASN